MTISALLMILALAVGSGPSQSFDSDYPTEPDPADARPTKVATHCWINGVWYNPCPNDAPPPPPPGGDTIPDVTGS